MRINKMEKNKTGTKRKKIEFFCWWKTSLSLFFSLPVGKKRKILETESKNMIK